MEKKGKAIPKATLDGINREIGTLTGMNVTRHPRIILRITTSGLLPPKEKEGVRAKAKWIPHRGLTLKLCGAIFTKDSVTRPIGASTTLTALVQLLTMTDYGVRLATVLVIPPTPVTLPLFAYLRKSKVKESNRLTPTTSAIATGKARTFLLTIILIKLSQPCMMNPHLPLLKIGGRIAS